MKTKADVKLEDKISNMIFNTFDDLLIQLDPADVMDMSEGLAIKVIAAVKGQL